jgi:CDP-diacylglycerol--glycerol-3-phosphate 3-phosphatidyltransferase
MIASVLKPSVTKLIHPIARGLLRLGLTPNAMTVLGTIATCVAALTLLPSGHLLAASIVITLTVLTDLLDGTMARIRESGATKWGSFLDSTLDRISDAAIFLGLAIYLYRNNDELSIVVLVSMASGFMVSYIRAKAESLGVACSVGIAERTERLTIVLIGIGLAGLGVPHILAISQWLLAVLGIITVGQRIVVVRRATKDVKPAT